MIKLTFANADKIKALKELFAPYAVWIKENEPTTLAYSLQISDKEPLQAIICARFADKDKDYVCTHRGSQEYFKFQVGLKALGPKTTTDSAFEEVGFMSR